MGAISAFQHAMASCKKAIECTVTFFIIHFDGHSIRDRVGVHQVTKEPASRMKVSRDVPHGFPMSTATRVGKIDTDPEVFVHRVKTGMLESIQGRREEGGSNTVIASTKLKIHEPQRTLDTYGLVQDGSLVG
jgi:hypothetical protein